MIYQTMIRPTLLYGCEAWAMSVKDENASDNNIDENGAIGKGGEPVRTQEK